jgi:hypothetical protein
MYKIATWLKEDEKSFGVGRQYRPSPRGRGWQYRPPLPLEGERRGEGVNVMAFPLILSFKGGGITESFEGTPFTFLYLTDQPALVSPFLPSAVLFLLLR